MFQKSQNIILILNSYVYLFFFVLFFSSSSFHFFFCLLRMYITLSTPCRAQPGQKVIKMFMHNSAEHEILNAHEYKNVKKLNFSRLIEA